MLDSGVLRLSDKGDFQSQFSSPEFFAEEPKRGEWMARFARVIAVGIPHHITQRGNARRFILQDEADRKVYLDLLRQSTEQHGVALIGYCLMSNHSTDIEGTSNRHRRCRRLVLPIYLTSGSQRLNWLGHENLHQPRSH
jgi:hypothetical protein